MKIIILFGVYIVLLGILGVTTSSCGSSSPGKDQVTLPVPDTDLPDSPPGDYFSMVKGLDGTPVNNFEIRSLGASKIELSFIRGLTDQGFTEGDLEYSEGLVYDTGARDIAVWIKVSPGPSGSNDYECGLAVWIKAMGVYGDSQGYCRQTQMGMGTYMGMQLGY